jgi:RNA polymerase sigma-70 factor (ECF subfamily)
MGAEGADLVERMAHGDRGAFAAFYDRFAPLAFGLIRRILREPAEAEEVLQEVFFELWQAAGQYDALRGSPAAWVATRARSRAIDRVRSLRTRDERVAAEVESAAAQPAEPPPDIAAQVVERTSVRGALAQLLPAQREVIELAYLGGLTHTEISSRLKQPLGTVKTRIRSGLQSLRELLGEPALGARV